MPDQYAYTGKVIKLNARDYRRWSDGYAGGNDIVLSGWLEEIDDYLSSLRCPIERQKKWFHFVAKQLEKRSKANGGEIPEHKRQMWIQRYQEGRVVPDGIKRLLNLGEYAKSNSPTVA